MDKLKGPEDVYDHIAFNDASPVKLGDELRKYSESSENGAN